VVIINFYWVFVNAPKVDSTQEVTEIRNTGKSSLKKGASIQPLLAKIKFMQQSSLNDNI
jgi:hypothetical protein